MRNTIRKVGHVKLVLLITLFAIASAEILAYLFCKIFSFPYTVPAIPIIAFFIPLILGPIISWHLLKLLFTIDKLEIEMNNLATYDSLTSLLSRQAFFKHSLHIHENAIATKKSYIVAIIDIDNFKHINDTYGHGVGDKVLENLGNVFQSSFNDAEIIGRIGGEEFALVMSITPKNQQKIIDAFRKKVANEVLQVRGHSLNYTISIGVFNNHSAKDTSFNKALSNADYALYHAKVTGKNKTVIFTHSLVTENMSKQSSYLRKHIEHTRET